MSASLRGRTIGIIGTGRVGSALAAALTEAGHPVVPREPADVTILAVPDDALASVVAGLEHPGTIVAHTSGAHGLGVLAPAGARGARPLAGPPALTFTRGAGEPGPPRQGHPLGRTPAPD